MNRAEHVLAVADELLQRGGLEAAVSRLSCSSLCFLLKVIAESIAFKGEERSWLSLQLLYAVFNKHQVDICTYTPNADAYKPLITKICQVIRV